MASHQHSSLGVCRPPNQEIEWIRSWHGKVHTTTLLSVFFVFIMPLKDLLSTTHQRDASTQKKNRADTDGDHYINKIGTLPSFCRH